MKLQADSDLDREVLGSGRRLVSDRQRASVGWTCRETTPGATASLWGEKRSVCVCVCVCVSTHAHCGCVLSYTQRRSFFAELGKVGKSLKDPT